MGLRTRQEIDIEYRNIATQYGDRVHRSFTLQDEIKKLHEAMQKLQQEPSAEDVAARQAQADAFEAQQKRHLQAASDKPKK